MANPETQGSRDYPFETVEGWAFVSMTAAGLRRVGWPGSGRPGPVRTVPGAVGSLLVRLQRHWDGQPQRYDDVRMDLSGVPPFHRDVYAAARALAVGETCTYGELAKRLGAPGAARAVGQALARNPLPLVVPCHRVLAAGGRPGGFSAPGGLITKARLLREEGVLLRLSPR